jgi:hypothetical protein
MRPRDVYELTAAEYQALTEHALREERRKAREERRARARRGR